MPSQTMIFTFWIIMWIIVIIVLSAIYIDDAYGPLPENTTKSSAESYVDYPKNKRMHSNIMHKMLGPHYAMFR